MALKVGVHADIIEIGTPQCKATGVDAVRAVREVFPEKLSPGGCETLPCNCGLKVLSGRNILW